MDRQFNQPKRLKAEDFRRLGVRLQEWRPAIIREAAAKIAKELARKQLESPTDRTARELSNVTVSAYRVLDPRRRHDSNERISVGRILPLALHAASQTRFCNGLSEPQIAQQLATTLSTDASELLSDESLEEMIRELVPATAAFGLSVTTPSQSLHRVSLPTVALQSESNLNRSIPLRSAFDPGNHVAGRLESDSLLRYYPLKRFLASARRVIQRPAFVASLIVLTLGATIWVSRFGRFDKHVVASNPVRPMVSSTTMIHSEVDAAAASMGPAQVATSAVSPPSDPADPVDPVDPVVRVQAVFGSGNEDAPGTASLDGEPYSAEHFNSRNTDTQSLTHDTVDSVQPWLRSAGQRVQQWMAWVDEALASAKVNSKSEPTVVLDSLPSLSHPTVMAFDQVGFPVPDEPSLAEAETRLRRLLPQTVNLISPETSETLIKQLNDVQSAAKLGTADHWVATLFMAKVGWSIRDASQVCSGLQVLADSYRIAVEPLLAESFLERQPFIETAETHRLVLRSGFSVAESLLRNQWLEQCRQVVDSTRRSAEFLADDEAILRLQEYEDALEQMSRLRLKANEIVLWADSSDITSSDAAIAGRYECLYRRNWPSGLVWLANSKDPRMAVLAQSELEWLQRVSSFDGQSGSDASPLVENEWTQLAARWLAVASRNTGRVAESMRLHALTLNQRALTTARGTQKLMIQRAIDEIHATLSDAVFDSAQNSVPASRPL